MREDSLADLLTCRCPGIHPVMRIQYIGKVECAVQGDPTHELGVQEISWLATHLPDALVVIAPAGCRGVGHLDQEVARDLVESTEFVAQAVCRPEEFAVDIELALLPGAIAHAHRPAGTPSRQVLERAFREIALAANAEHNLNVNTAPDLAG